MPNWCLLWPLVLATLVTTPAFADPAPAPSGSAAPAQRFRQARADILRKRLGLDDKKAREVEKLLDSYAPERKKLRETIKDQQKALRDLVKKDSDDQNAFKRALIALADAQTRLNTLRVEEQAGLMRLLTPKQQAVLLQVMAHVRRQRLSKQDP